MTTAQRSSAYAMIEAKGQTVTLTARSAGSYDTATASSSITTSTRTGKGVILPLAAYRKAANAIIVEGDENLLLAAVDTSGAALTAPKVNSEITDANGKVYTLVGIETLAPAGLPILFDCIVRASA